MPPTRTGGDDAIKHVVDNSIVFQQDTAPVCNQQGLYHLGVRCHRNVSQQQTFCWPISM